MDCDFVVGGCIRRSGGLDEPSDQTPRRPSGVLDDMASKERRRHPAARRRVNRQRRPWTPETQTHTR
jgi:hypothetical protein